MLPPVGPGSEEAPGVCGVCGDLTSPEPEQPRLDERLGLISALVRCSRLRDACASGLVREHLIERYFTPPPNSEIVGCLKK